MLKSITVTNFKGFKNPITLDLSQTRDYEFNSFLLRNRLVNKALIYGKNGCGKTNLGLAIFDITQHLTDYEKSEIRYKSYLNYENRSPARFDFIFQFDNTTIEYSYEKSGYNLLSFESLIVNGEKYLSADYKKKVFKINTMDDYLQNLRLPELDSSLSLVKYVYSHSEKKTDAPITKMMDFVSGMLWFRALDDGRGFIGLKSGSASMDELVIKNNKLKEFEKFLKENEVNYKLTVFKNADKEQIGVDFNGQVVPLSWVASSGTWSLWLFFSWELFFNEITFLFLDEFDAFYHYETSECVLNKTNSNPNMQAIVTSHNTSLMNNKLTRPDCCFIMSGGYVKALCDCTDKEIREAHNLEKMYRNGAFV